MNVSVIDTATLLLASLLATTCGGRSAAQSNPQGVQAQAAPRPLPTATPSAPSSDALQTLHWHGKTKSLEVRAVNGPVRAVPSSDDQADVVARVTKNKHGKQIRLQVVEKGALTLVCIVPAEGNDDDEDDDDDKGKSDPDACANSGHGRSTAVELVVQVPKGVKFAGWTVNGSVDAQGLQGEVEAHTQNGSVHIETTSIARASTVNGSIRAKLGATSWDGTVALESVNGRVEVELPNGVGALLKADTVHGSVRVAPRMDAARVEETHVEGRLGKGGGELHLRTVNGPIDVR